MHRCQCAVLLILALHSWAQEPTVEITRWLGDRDAALSLTFDDGLRDHIEIAVPVLDAHGLRATWFICPGQTPESTSEALARRPDRNGSVSWQEWEGVLATGHEIGNHSWSHPRLTDLTDPEQVRHQIDNAYERIQQRLGVAPISFCYPFNAWNEPIRAVVEERHLTARYHYLHYGGNQWNETAIRHRLQTARIEGEWLNGMAHAIEHGYSAFPEGREQFEAHVAWLAEQQAWLWIAPMGEVAEYAARRDAFTVAIATDGDAYDIAISGALPRLVEHGPITIRIADVDPSSLTVVDNELASLEQAGDDWLLTVPTHITSVRLR